MGIKPRAAGSRSKYADHSAKLLPYFCLILVVVVVEQSENQKITPIFNVLELFMSLAKKQSIAEIIQPQILFQID